MPKKKKKSEKFFRFWDNCIWKCCNKLPLLRKEYLSSLVNLLTNSSKILHLTKSDFFRLHCLHSDQYVKVLSFRFQQSFGGFTILLVEGSSETWLLSHCFSVVRKFKNTSAMKVIFFFENIQNWIYISKLSLREIFSNPIALRMINKYGRGAAIQNSTVFQRVYHVTFRRVLWNRTF